MSVNLSCLLDSMHILYQGKIWILLQVVNVHHNDVLSLTPSTFYQVSWKEITI